MDFNEKVPGNLLPRQNLIQWLNGCIAFFMPKLSLKNIFGYRGIVLCTKNHSIAKLTSDHCCHRGKDIIDTTVACHARE